MKIFGLNISWNKNTEDRVVVRTVVPSTTPTSKIKKVKIGSLSYPQQIAGGRGNFIGSEYDLSEIGKIEDVDSFVRQSFKKKEGLMFKEGILIKGTNKDTVRYYKTRMKQIAQASGIPESTLIKRIGRSLIRVSNAFLVKVRDENASGGAVRTLPSGKTLKPVAAYFPAAPETMKADLNKVTGEINGWRQSLPDGRYRDYSPEDVIHFKIDCREGFFYGTPSIIPVIDDIRALRQIEENIELLLYQHLFPLFHYKVGTETAPAGYTESGVTEVDAVQDQIRMMPSEGAIVTPERHEIRAIGSEGRALRAEGYLNHFKKRVFTGLGVSSVDMGEGDTANRATANTLSRALVDAVKTIQDDLEAQWDHFVISELLLESTFGEDVLDDEFMVSLKFAEIDIKNKLEMQNHAIELWKSNGLTFDEFRSELGREPIPIPEDANDQDPSKYPEWNLTYWKLIDEPLNLIRAVDEPYSASAQAAAQARSTSLTEKNLERAQEARDKEAKKSKDLKVKNKDNYLSSSFRELEEDTKNRIQASIINRGIIDSDYLLSFAQLWGTDISDKMTSTASLEFIRGFNDSTGNMASYAEVIIGVAREDIRERVAFRIDKLVKDTISLISARVDSNIDNVKLIEAKSEVIEELHVSFESTRYRTDSIWDVEIRKAYNYGKISGMRFVGKDSIELQAYSDDSCEKCKAVDGSIIPIGSITLDSAPPYHPYSRMTYRALDHNSREDN